MARAACRRAAVRAARYPFAALGGLRCGTVAGPASDAVGIGEVDVDLAGGDVMGCASLVAAAFAGDAAAWASSLEAAAADWAVAVMPMRAGRLNSAQTLKHASTKPSAAVLRAALNFAAWRGAASTRCGRGKGPA